MFELPEYLTLAGQMNETLTGKTVRKGSLGNSPHKFVWYNRSHAEFEGLTQGKTVGEARVKGRWLFLPFEPGYVLVLGECGGKVLYHPGGSPLPQKYHLLIEFSDGSALSAFTQMWGAMELYAAGEEQERQYIKGMRPTPVDPAFTQEYLDALVAELSSRREAQRQRPADPGPDHTRIGQRHRSGHPVRGKTPPPAPDQPVICQPDG